MFRRKNVKTTPSVLPQPAERVTSVLGPDTVWKGSLSGSGGVRVEGAFEGEIALRGMLVIGATGRVTCMHLRASTVIVAGALRGDITAERVEIRSTGRVWGDVITAAFSTEEGAFLRGNIQMEDKVDIGVVVPEKPSPDSSIETGGEIQAPEVEENPPAEPQEPATSLEETQVNLSQASQETQPASISDPEGDEQSLNEPAQHNPEPKSRKRRNLSA